MDEHCFLSDWREIILSTSFPSPLATFCSSLLLPFLGVHEAMGPFLIPAGAFKECYDTVRQRMGTWHEQLMSHLICSSIISDSHTPGTRARCPETTSSPSLRACSRSVFPGPALLTKRPPLLRSVAVWCWYNSQEHLHHL